MHEITCFNCGKNFKITPTRLKKNKVHTCSRKCLGEYNSKMYNKKIKTNCRICDREIFYKQSAFKKIKDPTCSIKCSAKMKQINMKGSGNPKALNLSEEERYFWNKYTHYRYAAKTRNLDFDLDYKFLLNLFKKQNGLCFYSGIPMKTHGTKDYDTISLDRVDSNKGYIKNNVVFCLNSVNIMKSNHNLSDLQKVFDGFFVKRSKMDVKIKKFSEDAKLPQKANLTDAGYDLFTHKVEDFGHYIKVYSGIGLQPQLGYWYMLVPRSSTHRQGLSLYNNCGIIDNSFRGEITGVFLKDDSFKNLPEKNSRIMQIIPMKQYFMDMEQVEELEESERGTNGYGSSGS